MHTYACIEHIYIYICIYTRVYIHIYIYIYTWSIVCIVYSSSIRCSPLKHHGNTHRQVCCIAACSSFDKHNRGMLPSTLVFSCDTSSTQ